MTWLKRSRPDISNTQSIYIYIYIYIYTHKRMNNYSNIMLLVFVKFLHDLNQSCGTDVFLIKSCPAVDQALDLTIIKIGPPLWSSG
jgi:hypothetical protein